jgi:hypothetical protein
MLNRPFVVVSVVMLTLIVLSACGGSDAPVEIQATVTPAPFPRPFVPTATFGSAEISEPLALDDAIQVENAALSVEPPGECHLVENLKQTELAGSSRAFNYKLNFGFGCPSVEGNLRLDEVRFQTASSVAAYDSACASGGCDVSRVSAADFDAQQTALQSGQAATGWTLMSAGGRSVLVRSVQVAGAPVVMRQYAEFCGDVRVENRIVILGDDASALEANADSFFTSLGVICQSGA